MSSSALPPPSNLPSWSRVSTLDRSRYPRPFVRDRLRLAPGGATTITTDNMVDFNANLANVDVKILGKVSTGGQYQSICYDKSVKFLQQQHAETLRKLHEELDALKRQNKELQFKVVLAHQGSPPPGGVSISKVPYSQNTPSDIETLLLKEEIKDLKQALLESSAKSEIQHKALSLGSATQEQQEIGDSELFFEKVHRRKFSVSSLSTPLPLNATLTPLRVRDSALESPRVPSVADCEAIIQKMHETNCQQLAELSRLRTNLRNVTSVSENSTPEMHLTRTYGPAKNESFSDTRLPRIPVKPATKKSIKSANMTEIKVTLPALKNTIPTNIAARQRRQHAMQKSNKKF